MIRLKLDSGHATCHIGRCEHPDMNQNQFQSEAESVPGISFGGIGGRGVQKNPDSLFFLAATPSINTTDGPTILRQQI